MIVYSTFWLVTIALGVLVRRKTPLILYFFGVFLFVGLRMETGFDWPVYKDAFEHFQDGFSWLTVARVQLLYSQETAFIIILGLMGQVIQNYEVNQAIFTLFFLYSFYKLSNTMPGARPALALAIYFSFFLLSVGFSTVRQALAISFFNMALYHFFQKDCKRTTYIFFAAAIAVHLSASVYVLAFVFARIMTKIVGKIGTKLYLIGSLGLLMAFPSGFALVASLLPRVHDRFSYYQNLTILQSPSLFSILFALLLLMIGLFLAFKRRVPCNTKEAAPVFQNLIILLSAISFASLFFSTLRDRLSYELILLFSIYISARLTTRNLIAAAIVSGFGLYYQFSILRPPRDLAFIPYQNSLLLYLMAAESTGAQRNSQYMEIFIEDLEK